jgi:hypothetical protein
VLPAAQQRNWADQQLGAPRLGPCMAAVGDMLMPSNMLLDVPHVSVSLPHTYTSRSPALLPLPPAAYTSTAQEAAATLDRASGKAQPTKRRRGGGGVSDAAEPGSRRATKGKAVAGWSYTAPPHHAPKGAQAAAARTALRALELNELSDDDADVAGAARTSRDQGARRTGDGAAGSDIGLSAEYRRAAAMRSSRAALLAEMRTWEEDDAERDAAAAAGLVRARACVWSRLFIGVALFLSPCLPPPFPLLCCLQSLLLPLLQQRPDCQGAASAAQSCGRQSCC